MLSYTKSLTLYQNLTKDSTTRNTDIFNVLLNEKIRSLLSSFPRHFLERSKNINTVASQQFYDLPFNFKKMLNCYITVGSTKYIPLESPNRDYWDELNRSVNTSTMPQYYFIFNNQIGFYPIPSASSNVITINYEIRVKDLSIADYTTGTITTATNGDETIVGSGTTWTTKMAGRWIRITDSDTANTGDGEWYKIDSVTDATNLELVSPYQGSSITAGSANYVIGQMSEIPEDYQMIPIYECISDYWWKEDKNKAQAYAEKAKELKKEMNQYFSSKTKSPVIEESLDIKNPNLFIEK